MSRNNDSEGKE